MNSCPTPATRSRAPPFPCWRGQERPPLEPAQPELVTKQRFPLRVSVHPVVQAFATSPPPRVQRRTPPSPMLRLRPRALRLPAANEFRHGLRGRDDGATFALSAQRPRLARAQAQVSTGAATRLPEPQREFL